MKIIYFSLYVLTAVLVVGLHSLLPLNLPVVEALNTPSAMILIVILLANKVLLVMWTK